MIAIVLAVLAVMALFMTAIIWAVILALRPGRRSSGSPDEAIAIPWRRR